MTAAKNDKIDAKPAMQFVTARIWETIRSVEREEISNFDDVLMDLISLAKDGNEVYEDILCLIASQYGRAATLRAVGLAMRAGEIKYGDWNFLGGHGRYQLLGAMERHAMLILEGEFGDPDTSDRLNTIVPHYGCIVAGINMTWWQEDYGTLRSDGPPPIINEPQGVNSGLRIESSTKATGTTGTSTR